MKDLNQLVKKESSPFPYDIENVYMIIDAVEEVIKDYPTRDIKAAFGLMLRYFREGKYAK